MKHIKIMMLCIVATMMAGCTNRTATVVADNDELALRELIEQDIEYCVGKAEQALLAQQDADGNTDYTRQLRNIPLGEQHWTTRPSTKEEWCSGFWPGILWMAAQADADRALTRNSAEREQNNEDRAQTLSEAASRYAESLDFLASQPAYDHDLGFIMIGSHLKGWEMNDDERYRELLLRSADTLATLFDEKVGTMLSWPRNKAMFGGHNTIMDNMINLELLFWAAKHGGDKRLFDIAVRHAETTMKHHFREDGSSYHVAVYDSTSGSFIRGCTHQGLNDDSMWARGQAWAIYGYTMVFRETHDVRFLEQAIRATNVYLDRLPEGLIPYWDFSANDYFDASAACIVASALMDLHTFVEDDEALAQRYRDAAFGMLATLRSDAFRSNKKCDAFLLHSVGNYPAGSEIDASIIYADYYYLEALLKAARLLGKETCADYSDPDVCEGKEGDYWMTASSFQCIPGLPILHSTDLVNWTLVNYAVHELLPKEHYDKPQHGKGVWAPSIRLHDGTFYIFWGDPDFGIFMVKTQDPRSTWSEPQLVVEGKGLIDPCPLWDEDGRLYLINGWAASRCGFNSILTIRELNADATKAISTPRIVYDGQIDGKQGPVNHTVEGPKLYRKDGFYYILAPAGGVEHGWQLALRSKNIYGPYESHIVYNHEGIHQGGMVGNNFIAFQERGAYGRVLHLLDIDWTYGWPKMKHSNKKIKPITYGDALPGNGFTWHANYQDWYGFALPNGDQRVYGCEPMLRDGAQTPNSPNSSNISNQTNTPNLWDVPNLWLCKFDEETFTRTMHLTVTAKADGHDAGLVVMGRDYCRLGVRFEDGKFLLRQAVCIDAETQNESAPITIAEVPHRTYNAGALDNYECELWLQLKVDRRPTPDNHYNAICHFAYSADGKFFTTLPQTFKARQGKWIGAKYGIYCITPTSTNRNWCDMHLTD